MMTNGKIGCLASTTRAVRRGDGPSILGWVAVGALVLNGLLAAPTPVAADTVLDRDAFAELLAERQSDFLARDLRTRTSCSLSGSDLETRYAPWSSFKIPNALIALETGVVDGLDHWRDWDQKARPASAYWPEGWRRGQTLKTAFQRSAVWYFQDLALEVGAPRYRTMLTEWGYGNADVPDGSDAFWLGGPLTVSVREHVRFLSRLMTGELGVDGAHLADLSKMAEDGTFANATLHGKTGAGPVAPGQFSGAFEGWYAGWLSQNGVPTVVFAHHARGQSYAAIQVFRKDVAVALLDACGMLDAGN